MYCKILYILGYSNYRSYSELFYCAVGLQAIVYEMLSLRSSNLNTLVLSHNLCQVRKY